MVNFSKMLESMATPKPERKHFAAGDYVTRYASGSDPEIIIDSPHEKRNWKPRAAETATRAMFPGTAILLDGAYYEVISRQRLPGDPARYVYSLNPWPDGSPIRVQFAYTREECERAAASAAHERNESRLHFVLLMLSPLLGLLPARDQLRVQNNRGISAVTCTTLSIFLTLSIGGFAVILTLISMIAPSALLDWPVIGHLPVLVLALFGLALCGESLMRLISIRHEEPAGSFLVCAPIELFRTFVRSNDSAHRMQKIEAMDTGPASVFLKALDEIRELNETDLEIVSLLPKPDWGVSKGVLYNDTWYGCVETGRLEGKEVRYRFVLRKAPPGAIFRTTCSYSKEDAQQRYRDKRRQDLGTWVDTFAPFWGLLEAGEQKRLNEIYGFNSLKYTSWTIAALMVVGALNVIASVGNMIAHTATASDALWLLGGGYLLLENIVRLQKWLKREASGSILGVLLRPLASILVKA